MTALDRLAKAAARHEAEERRWLTERDAAILDARAAGATWEQVAAAAGMSRAGVINAANAARGGRQSRG